MKNYKKPKKLNYPKSKYKPLKGKYPGEYVQIDVKFVHIECIGFKSNYERYYQITAIDLYSRKRILKLVNEHNAYETAKMLKTLETDFGFKIRTYKQIMEESFVMIENKRNLFLKKY